MSRRNTIAIIGAGAAGLVAAIVAARNGAEVILLEKNSRVGRKILATGNGRCNMTNIDLDMDHFHGTNPYFAQSALAQFGYNATVSFFEELGIEVKVEEDGRAFPMSLQASSVLDVLRFELQQLGVEERVECKVRHVKRKGKQFVLDLTNGNVVKADKVLIATGGKAAPKLGSTGDGYELSCQLGHRIVEPFPVLVQLILDLPYLKRLSGIKIEGGAEIFVDSRSVASAKGEILFTKYGVSGPPIFDLSRWASEGLKASKRVEVRMNVLPEYTEEELRVLLRKRFSDGPKKDVVFSFVGLVHKQLAPVLMAEAGISDLRKLVSELSSAEEELIAETLQKWTLSVTGTQTWTNAQATAGGVNVNDINPTTMESKIVPGLHFAGEVMDIDGDCGGYNLQWAWSSGFVAGVSMTQD